MIPRILTLISWKEIENKWIYQGESFNFSSQNSLAQETFNFAWKHLRVFLIHASSDRYPWELGKGDNGLLIFTME